MKLFLTTISTILSVAMYGPQFHKILTKKKTDQYSKVFLWAVFALQVNNLLLAISESAWYLVFIYALHIGLVGATLWLVYKYYNGAEITHTGKSLPTPNFPLDKRDADNI